MKIYYINENKCMDLTPRLPELTPEQEIKLAKLGITALIITKVATGNVLYASTGINDAVQPLVNILKDLAEPVSYGFFVKGFLEMISGKEHEGKKTIKYSATGFLGIQFIPQIMKIIKSINIGG